LASKPILDYFRNANHRSGFIEAVSRSHQLTPEEVESRLSRITSFLEHVERIELLERRQGERIELTLRLRPLHSLRPLKPPAAP
jgi:hypothetical protein